MATARLPSAAELRDYLVVQPPIDKPLDEPCPICFEPYTVCSENCSHCSEPDHAHVAVRLDKNHDFGYPCIRKWLQATNTCPLCRDVVCEKEPPEDQEEEEDTVRDSYESVDGLVDEDDPHPNLEPDSYTGIWPAATGDHALWPSDVPDAGPLVLGIMVPHPDPALAAMERDLADIEPGLEAVAAEVLSMIASEPLPPPALEDEPTSDDSTYDSPAGCA